MKKFAAALLCCAACLFAAGCGDKTGGTEGYTSLGKSWFDIMNTNASLAISEKFDEESREKMSRLCDEVSSILYGVNSSLSLSVETSCAARFNSAAAGETVPLDKLAYDVFNLAEEMYELTEGYYNPAVYYSVNHYKFNMGYPEVHAEDLPDEQTLAAYTDLASHFGEIQLYIGEDGAYYAKKPQYTVTCGEEELSLKIDLGGIGKGYAVDLINDKIDEYGFKYGSFDFGSSSMAIKSHYSQGDYKISFTNPRPIPSDEATRSYGYLYVANKCLSSSGDYENCYTLGGKRYCHVIDPFTGTPVSIEDTPAMSCTVIGDSAAYADALTTALMAMATHEGWEHTAGFVNEKLQGWFVAFTIQLGDDNFGLFRNGDFTVTDDRFVIME